VPYPLGSARLREMALGGARESANSDYCPVIISTRVFAGSATELWCGGCSRRVGYLKQMAPIRTTSLDRKTNKRILVADDKATGRELVRTVLESRGYEVFEASDGIQALDSAHRLHPDLIILDLHMPGLDGFGVVKELRLDAYLATIPVVALTASAMQGDRQRAMSAGFTGYITKPVSLKTLRAEVERLLA